MSAITTPSPSPPQEEGRPKRRSLLADVERELRDCGRPYVEVNKAKKAMFSPLKLKSFHLVVYDKEHDNWLLWCGEPTTLVRQNMAEWARVFGEGYQVVFAVRRGGGIAYRTASGAHLMLT
jgi:hypothetical protein